jgi:hypothetical protein
LFFAHVINSNGKSASRNDAVPGAPPGRGAFAAAPENGENSLTLRDGFFYDRATTLKGSEEE